MAIKRSPNRSPQTGGNRDDNRKFLLHDLEIVKWGDVPMSDPKAVEERCFKYLEWCAEDDVRPSIAGLSLSLGVSRQRLLHYRDGSEGRNPEVRVILNKVISLFNSQMENYMQNGQIHPVCGIFLMKNNYGYRDQQEITVEPKTPLGDTPDQNALEAKYIGDVIVDFQ